MQEIDHIFQAFAALLPPWKDSDKPSGLRTNLRSALSKGLTVPGVFTDFLERKIT
jgi:hypothetical protein